MVTGSWAKLATWGAALLAAEEQQPLLKRLDPATRAKVLAALAALLILGFTMMVLVWLGGRFTRRYINLDSRRRDERTPLNPDDWAGKPLAGEDSDES